MSVPTNFVQRHRATVAATAVVALAASALIAYAVSAEGYAARHVDLNDGGIWVTNNADGLYGRLNKPISQLDAGFYPPGGAQAAYTVDIVQDGSAVLAFDKGTGKVFPVDVRAGAPVATQAAAVPGNDELQLAGSTAAVLDPSSGRLWAARVGADDMSGLAALDTAQKPLTTVGPGADLAIAADGTIFAASAVRQQLVTIRPAGTRFAKPAVSQLHRQMAALAITAVGDTPIVLDVKGGVVLLPGGHTTAIPKQAAGGDAVLQQPGPSAAFVALATPSALVSVPLNGAAATTLFDGGSGVPAQPVVLGNCVHAAWGGTPGQYARSCDGQPVSGQKLPPTAKISQPVFRVNRGQIVLNDLASGGVWIIDDVVRQVDDWQAIRPPKPKPNSKKPSNPTHEKQPSAQDRPPQPKPDTLGARPGRTTVLHVLDNDSDPDGDILAITSVTGVDSSAAAVSVSADGQTAEVVVPPSATADIHFKYTVSDGKGQSASTDVTVQLRKGDVNEAPSLRLGYDRTKVWSVAAGGTFSYPVLSDWRDFDGDPLALVRASVPQGTVATTPDGSIVFSAPGDAGVQAIQYQVSDAIGDPVAGTVKVKVLARSSTDAVSATAEPDVVRAVVGRPITISPLANDVPGSDPTDPSAKLTLAAPLPQPVGASVTTDLAGSTVTVVAKHAGTLSLKYQAAFGSAKLSSGVIRVDAVANPAATLPPVAMPDTAVLHGQQAATVDVLANDFDPSGDVLVVQRAVAADDAGLEIAVIQGHWLRIWSTQPVSPGVRLVHYSVTDGSGPPVTGQVSVLQLPAAPTDTAPTPIDDLATVRAGDSVDVPVLDNDVDADGDPLTLKPGRLVTTPPGLGAAYVSGNLVRYAAPASVASPTQVVVDYVAVDPSGETTVGHARITINPLPADEAHDQPPNPSPVTRSVVAGDQITITVPWTGVDPDGDSVTVTGLASAPQLGRIVATGPTTLTYQAYPLASGTDTFSYQVSDRFGLSGTATMRIGVVPPGDPQPPVAVDDNITAAPGTTVHAAVLGNDLTAPGDDVTIAPLATTNDAVPNGVSLQDDRIVVKVPPATGKPLVVSYAITDGTGGRSVAQLVVDSQPKYDIPPIARDDVAKVAPGATSATVDVLANDEDPDSSPEGLSISRVFAPTARIVDRKLVVPVQAFPQAVAYEVRDRGAATSMALVHVPGNGTAQPHLRPDVAAIELTPGSSKTINIADYVVDPANKPLRLTTTDRIWASPDNGLAIASKNQTSLVLTAKARYQGPAAAIFEVSDGTSLSDPRAQKAIVAVPVQIGKPQPVLRCPTGTLTAVQGGAPLKLDIATLCHVWVDNPATLGQLDFTTSWAKQPPGVSIAKSGNSGLVITPGSQAKPGTSGVIKVGVAGASVSATLNVRVVKAPPPVVEPITVRGLRAGASQTVDLRSYVQSPIQSASVSVVDVHQLSGSHLDVSSSGPRITLSAPRDIHGTMTFDLTVTDVAGAGHADRHVPGRLSVEVLGLPGTPGRPSIQSVTSHTIVLGFAPPAANGAPLDEIQLRDSRGGTHSCPASPCTVGGLKNGQSYSFTVRGRNVVGWGPFSAPSVAGKPDKVPDPVTGVLATAKDRSAAVRWTAGHPDGSPISSYQVQTSPAPSSGQAITTVQGTSTTLGGLDNGTTYGIRVRALNAQGAGAWGPSAQVIPFGRPPAMAAPNAQGADSTDNAEKAITVSWPAADGNGRAISKYTVTEYRNGAAAGTQTATGLSTTFGGVANDGSKYTYSVTATNAGNLTSPPSPRSAAVLATAPPAQVGGVNAADHDASHTNGYDGTIHVSFTLPQPHGATLTRVEYQVSNGAQGSWGSPGSPGAGVTESIGGLNNGTSYSAQVRGCNEANQCGPWSPSSNTVTPFGAMTNPSASGSTSGCTVAGDTTGSIAFNWAGGSGNGRPATYQINVDGAGWSNQGAVPNGGSTTRTFSCNSTHSIQVRIVRTIDGSSQFSGVAPDSEALPNPPPPANPGVSLSRGASAQGQSGCGSVHCHYLHIAMSNFPSGSYTVDCMENGSKFNIGTITVSATANKDLPCYNGNNADVFLRVFKSGGNVDSNHVNPATQW